MSWHSSAHLLEHWISQKLLISADTNDGFLPILPLASLTGLRNLSIGEGMGGSSKLQADDIQYLSSLTGLVNLTLGVSCQQGQEEVRSKLPVLLYIRQLAITPIRHYN